MRSLEHTIYHLMPIVFMIFSHKNKLYSIFHSFNGFSQYHDPNMTIKIMGKRVYFILWAVVCILYSICLYSDHELTMYICSVPKNKKLKNQFLVFSVLGIYNFWLRSLPAFWSKSWVHCTDSTIYAVLSQVFGPCF